jgi:hypothetical protein
MAGVGEYLFAPCPHDIPPFGYCIQHSNSPDHPCWLVMRWGEILAIEETLMLACKWLSAELEGHGCGHDDPSSLRPV